MDDSYACSGSIVGSTGRLVLTAGHWWVGLCRDRNLLKGVVSLFTTCYCRTGDFGCLLGSTGRLVLTAGHWWVEVMVGQPISFPGGA